MTRLLPVGPLRRWMAGAGIDPSDLNTADRRVIYRADASGFIAEPLADRIALRCGIQLELIYDLVQADL